MSSVFYIIATLKKMLISFRLLQCWNIGQYFWWHHHFLALEIYHTCFFSATSGVGTFWSKLPRFLVAVDCDLQTKYIVGTKSSLMQEKLPMCFGLINHKYIVLAEKEECTRPWNITCHQWDDNHLTWPGFN